MEIRQDDTYRTECRYGLSSESSAVLALLFQPLIGSAAVSLYITMTAEASLIHGTEKHRRLLSLTGLNINEFTSAVSGLEEYGLLKTWCRESGDHTSYIYELCRIPSAQEFISRHGYITRYLSVMGKEETEAALARFGASSLSKAGYIDVTRPVSDESNAEHRTVHFTEEHISSSTIRGDTLWPQFSRFISKTSTLVLPAELRTPDNLNLICRLASVNGLSAETMREITGKCVDMNNVSLNTEKLKLLASRAKPAEVQSEDPYKLPPAAFLEKKQNGIPVTGMDRSILQYLAADMHFPDEVINVMIEYILNISSNRLNRKFVESVAGEWARDGITTREQAVEQTKKSFEQTKKQRPYITVEAPAYYKKQKEGALPEEHSASAELLEKVRRMQKKMGGDS